MFDTNQKNNFLSAGPAAGLKKKKVESGFDPEKVYKEDENLSVADIQYESEVDSQYQAADRQGVTDKPTEEFSAKKCNAIRLVLKANKITKAGNMAVATLARNHTRGQNKTATKAEVKELADKVRDLKKVLTGFFSVMENKEEIEEKRWTAFHKTSVKRNKKWEVTLHNVEMMRNVQLVDGKDELGQDVMKEGTDWCDRMESIIAKVAAEGVGTRDAVDRLCARRKIAGSEGSIKLEN